jgi:protein TonB
MLPPPEVLRQVLPPPPRPPAAEARPLPPPTPPPSDAKDRISVGAPSSERAKGPLLLRREDDLTQVPKGTPNAVPSAAPPTAEKAEVSPARQAELAPSPGTEGLRLPPGIGELASGEEGQRSQPGERRSPSIASSLKNLERRLQVVGPSGLQTGTGQQMGPLFFDPLGADFTVWINHFKNEVYRNWIVPQSVLMGFHGHVDLEFSVERNGGLTNLRMLKSSGTPALDRAAMNALLGSRLLALPADYGPPRVTMQVTFYYNEGPRES